MMTTGRSLLLLALALPACAGGLREENDALMARLAERDAEVARLQAERSAQAEAVETARKRVESLQSDLDAARKRLGELETRAARGDAARDELRQARAALESVHQEVARLQAEIETLAREIEPLAAPAPGGTPGHP
jgi:predicted  nucleic acid-binding Zn-ribbon protein